MADIDNTRTISIVQLAWASGFLEGEGSFGCHNGSPRVSAAQVQKEPLDRLIYLFGGHIWLKDPTGFGTKPIWTWTLPSRRSVEVMMTLYSFMSPKRRGEIGVAISLWKSARRLKIPGSKICRDGHPIEGKNIAMRGGYAKCRICQEKARRALRARKRIERNHVEFRSEIIEV